MFVHTRSSAPKRFAKFGWQTQTFCHKKVGIVIAKLESDRRPRSPKILIKGELKAHIHISLYESNTLIE